MRKLTMLGAVLAAVVFPTASHAQFQLGLRLGFAPAMGDVAKDSPMKDGIKSQIPLQLDALYKVTPEIAAGVYFSYGFVQLGDVLKCTGTGVDCSGTTMRFGVQGVYTFTKVSPQFVPWAGVGLGYESFTYKAEAGGYSATADTTGWEFLNVQAGGDYKLNPKFAVGPYVMLSIGQYSSFEGTSITDKGTHEWLNFGLRGKFDL